VGQRVSAPGYAWAGHLVKPPVDSV
jgi:hypothetical protein